MIYLGREKKKIGTVSHQNVLVTDCSFMVRIVFYTAGLWPLAWLSRFPFFFCLFKRRKFKCMTSASSWTAICEWVTRRPGEIKSSGEFDILFFSLNLNHKLSKSGENNHESFPRLNTLHPWNTLYMLRFVVSFVPPQVHSVHVQVSALVAWRWSEECSVTGSPNTSAGSSHESFAKRFVDYRQVV